MRIGVVTGWEPRNTTDVACDFTLRKPVHTAELLALVAAPDVAATPVAGPPSLPDGTPGASS